jgi:hypothetical protein
MTQDLIPMVVCTGMFAMIFGIVYVKSRENMAMIEKGMNPKQKQTKPWPFVNLKYGLLMIGAGLGLLLAFIVDHAFFNTAAHTIAHATATATAGTTPGNNADINIKMGDDSDSLYFALIAIGGGIGLFLSYRIEKKDWLQRANNTAE